MSDVMLDLMDELTQRGPADNEPLSNGQEHAPAGEHLSGSAAAAAVAKSATQVADLLDKSQHLSEINALPQEL